MGPEDEVISQLKEKLERILEQVELASPRLAKTFYKMHKEFIDAGFTPDQAFALMQQTQAKMLQ